MNTKKSLLIAVLGLFMFGCGSNMMGNRETEGEQAESEVAAEEADDMDNVDTKFLITNSSAGYFEIGLSWQDIAVNEYDYAATQGYGICVDACCDGGITLGYIPDGYDFINEPDMTIGAVLFEGGEFPDDVKFANKHKKNRDLFFITSDNCCGWYWNDKINYLMVYSDKYKTAEGIGVGSTLEEMKKAFGKITISIGWIEEDGNAIQVSVDKYPTLRFILDYESAVGGYEALSAVGETAEISDFKPRTKIERVLVKNPSEETNE